MSVSLKYAHVEREQRFLLAEVPLHLKSVSVSEVHDRYLRGTRLRLRAVEEPGREPVLKLGQKIPIERSSPMALAHTTMYLEKADYDALAVLPADELRKSRRVTLEQGVAVAIDEFHGDLAGLVLAELDLGEHGQRVARLAIPVLAEVTEDERFAGRTLAAINAHALSSLLSEFTP